MWLRRGLVDQHLHADPMGETVGLDTRARPSSRTNRVAYKMGFMESRRYSGIGTTDRRPLAHPKPTPNERLPLETQNRSREPHSPTFVPQAAVPIAHLPLPYLREVEDADTQTDIMQNAVRVLLVQLVDDRLLGREAEVRGEDGDGVLGWARQMVW